MKVAIFVEDRYGPRFVKKMIHRLISEKFIKKIEYKPRNPSLIKKCHNVEAKVNSVVRDVERVIIVVDKEDTTIYDENKDIWRHLKNLKGKDKDKIHIIATEPEIGVDLYFFRIYF